MIKLNWFKGDRVNGGQSERFISDCDVERQRYDENRDLGYESNNRSLLRKNKTYIFMIGIFIFIGLLCIMKFFFHHGGFGMFIKAPEAKHELTEDVGMSNMTKKNSVRSLIGEEGLAKNFMISDYQGIDAPECMVDCSYMKKNITVDIIDCFAGKLHNFFDQFPKDAFNTIRSGYFNGRDFFTTQYNRINSIEELNDLQSNDQKNIFLSDSIISDISEDILHEICNDEENYPHAYLRVEGALPAKIYISKDRYNNSTFLDYRNSDYNTSTVFTDFEVYIPRFMKRLIWDS